MIDYRADFFGWATEQARLLRSGQVDAIDFENVAEEIESMGRSQRRELTNRLAVLLAHLLKWQYQPNLRGNSWRLTVEEQRIRVADHLDENPSLRALVPDAMRSAYRLALIQAQRESGLPASAFPAACPFTMEQATDEAFWPGE